MGKSQRLFFWLLAFILAACSSSDLSDSSDQKVFSDSWTPQYNSVVEYFDMASSLLSNNSPFFAMVGFNGTVVNPNDWGMQVTSGPVTFATHFDGYDDRVRVPFQGSLNQTRFSVALWIRVTGGSGDRCALASRDVLPTRGFSIYVDGSGTPQARLGNGSASAWAIASGAPVASGVWTHVAATFDGTTLRFYQNGAQAGVIFLNYVPNATRPLYIGAGGTELDPNATDFFPGDIDEVAIWSSVLSDTDIQTLYQHPYD